MMRLLTFAVCLMLANAHALAQSHTVFLVRHTEKASGQGDDPELTEAGRERAQRLRDALLPAKPSAVYATQYRRTQQTGQPLADAMALPITVLETSKERAGQYPDALLERICALPDASSVLVVGHSNTLPAIVGAWTQDPISPIEDDEHDRLFMVKLRACRVEGWADLRY
jgi:broad specificity phosphatase PhoE